MLWGVILSSLSAVAHYPFIEPTVWPSPQAKFPQYTDIDYAVFTGGALRAIEKPFDLFPQESNFLTTPNPYARNTYRYPPIMAILALPNLYVHPAAGKVIFCVCNILTAWALVACLRVRGCRDRLAWLLVSVCWLLNPLIISISARGNADSVMTLIVALLLLTTIRRQPTAAGCLLGLAVHMRLYPVIYSLPLLFFWGERSLLEGLAEDFNHLRSGVFEGKIYAQTLKLWKAVVLGPFQLIARQIARLNSHQWTFGLSALAVFTLLTASSYLWFGWPFLYETYLYHLKRHDHRHNFSILSAWSTLATPRVPGDVTSSLKLLKRTAQITQLPICLLLGLRYSHESPEFAAFIQTLHFVAFNTVSTAQYFSWYWSLLPLALFHVMPSEGLPRFWLKCSILVLFWATCVVAWVICSVRFEFKGIFTAFYEMFVCCLAFGGVNTAWILFMMRAQREKHLKTD